MKTLSQDAVRGLMIASLGLDEKPQTPATKAAILPIIRQIHMLQVDSIHVVARAPYFVLWSRLGSYDLIWLDELLEEGALFEYWAHANCFMPIEDYRLFRSGGWIIDWQNPQKWLDEHPAVADAVLKHVQMFGETRHT